MKDKPVNIQEEIDAILSAEFERLLAEHGDNPLLQLIRAGKLRDMPLEEIRENILGG